MDSQLDLLTVVIEGLLRETDSVGSLKVGELLLRSIFELPSLLDSDPFFDLGSDEADQPIFASGDSALGCLGSLNSSVTNLDQTIERFQLVLIRKNLAIASDEHVDVLLRVVQKDIAPSNHPLLLGIDEFYDPRNSKNTTVLRVSVLVLKILDLQSKHSCLTL